MNKIILPDAAAREKIEKCIEQNFLVEAGAGSGKTTCLVSRMLSIIKNTDADVNEIVAITFTRKAADELKQRFREKLERAIPAENDAAAKEKLSNALENFDNCFVGTIHAFCSRLLRERPIEAGLDFSFDELDDISEAVIRTQAWKDYLEDVRINSPDVLENLDSIGIKPDDLLESYTIISGNPDLDYNGNKTDKPDLKKHYSKLKTLIAGCIDVIPKTKPEGGYDKLQQNLLGADRLIRILDMTNELNIIKVLSPFEKEPKMTLKRWETSPADAKLIKADFIDFADDLADDMRKWREYCYYFILEFIKPAVKYYEEYRYKRSQLSFQDLLMKAAYLLKCNPDVRQYFQQKYKYLLVDEYQDTDPIQAQIIFFLTGTDIKEQVWQKSVSKPGSLFVVGDPKQSIYRFRRADIGIFNFTKTLIERSGGETLSLTANFRSLNSVCSVLNQTYKAIFPAEDDNYQAKFCTLDAVREDVPGTDFGVKIIDVTGGLSVQNEVVAQDAVSIAKYIKWALEGNIKLSRSDDETKQGLGPLPEPSDFMILLRFKNQMDTYSRELEKLGIPTAISGGSSFNAYPEIRELIKLLNASNYTNNEIFLVAALRGMFFGISDDDLYKFKSNSGGFNIFSKIPAELDAEPAQRFGAAFGKLKEYHQFAKTLSPAAAINKIINDCGIIPFTLSCDMGYRRCSSIYQLIEIINKLEIGGMLSFNEMVAWLEDLLLTTPENELSVAGESRNAVRIMNLHKAKGLEAPVVFLANPGKKGSIRVDMHSIRTDKKTEGYFCIQKAKGQFGKEKLAQPENWDDYEEDESLYLEAEEDRILYVAGTRAKNLLIVSSNFTKANNRNTWKRIADVVGKDCFIDVESLKIQETVTGSFKAENFTEVKEKLAKHDPAIFIPGFTVLNPSKIVDDEPVLKSDAAERYGPVFGIVMHSLFELLVKRSGVTDDDIKRVLTDNGLQEDILPVIQSVLENFKNSPMYARIKKSDTVLCEVPFSIKAEAGDKLLDDVKDTNIIEPVIFTGIIDLAFKEGDAWVIMDYKTNAVKDEEEKEVLVKYYTGQINLYRSAFERITNEKVKEAVLWFVRAV